MAFDCESLMARLNELEISTNTVEHPPLRTVDDAQRLRGDLPGGHAKNLFLKDKKKNYWLLVAPEDAAIDLKAAATVLEAQKFSFANAEELERMLGIVPGAVSPFAVINDQEQQVSLVVDERLIECSQLNFHPLRNDRTTAIATSDFLKFLEATKHKPKVLRLP